MSGEPTVEEPLAPQPTAPGRSISPLLAVLAVVAVVALVVMALVFTGVIGGGDGDSAAAPGEPTGPEAAAQDAQADVDDVAADDGSQLAAEALAVTFDVYLARDPFSPVVPEDEPEAADPDPSDPAAPTPTAPGDQPVDPVTGEPIPPGQPAPPGTPPPGTQPPPPGTQPPPPGTRPPSGACRGDDEVVCEGHVVTLEGLSTRADGTRVARIQVDQKVHEVAVGEVFAERFLLRAIDGGCVSVLYGDDGFRICEGDRVLK
jgi:hypothetical protein